MSPPPLHAALHPPLQNEGIRSAPTLTSASTQTKRGNKPFVLPPEVEEGLIRYLNYTSIPFDTIAKAVEQSKGGPKKATLRKWFQNVTGTKKVDKQRLGTVEPGSATERHEIQSRFIDAEALHDDQRAGAAQTTGLDNVASDGTDVPVYPIPDSGPQFSDHAQTQFDTGDAGRGAFADWLGQGQTTAGPPQRQNTMGTAGSIGNVADFAFSENDLPGYIVPRSPPPVPGVSRRTVTFASMSTDGTARDRPDDSNTSQSAKRKSRADSDGDDQDMSYAGRRRRTRMLSWSSIVGHLQELPEVREPLKRFVLHYARKSSRYAETIASCSSLSSRAPTLSGAYRADGSIQTSPVRNEYGQFYCNPSPNERVGRFLRDQGHTHLMASVPAPSFIMEAKFRKWSDDDVLDSLRNQGATEAQWQTWINSPDQRGVSALHLTVAYGFQKSTNFLCEHGADLKARTYRGTKVQHFAKSAQNLVHQDPSLLHRITVCLEFIRRNKIPPIPIADDNKSTSQRHEVHPMSSSSVYNQSGSGAPNNNSSVYPGANHRTDSGASSMQQANEWDGEETQFIRGLSTSPVSINRRQGTMNSDDFLPDPSRSGQHGRGGLRTEPKQRSPNRASTMAPSQQVGNRFIHPTPQHRFAAEPGTSSRMAYVHPSAAQSVPNFTSPLAVYSESAYNDPITTSSMGIATSDSFNHGFGASGMDQRVTISKAPTQLQPTAPLLGLGDLTPLSLAPQAMHSMQTHHDAQQFQAFPGWRGNGQDIMQPTVQHPPPQQPHVGQQPSRAQQPFYLGLPLGLAPVHMQQPNTQAPLIPPTAADATASEPVDPSIWHFCRHNRPLTNEESFCCFGCLPLNQL